MLMACRSRVHSATGASPLEMQLGERMDTASWSSVEEGESGRVG